MKLKMIAVTAAVALSVALAVAASGATGAYFSDTKSGAVAGHLGSIKVTTTGGAGVDALEFNWTDMVPGQTYSMTANFQNTGDNVQDVWLVFPNRTALSAFNSLGRWGAFRVESSGGAYLYSDNVQDHLVDQGLPHPTTGQIVRMLPQKIKLASNVGPTASGSMKFTFQYASATGNDAAGYPFNVYPIVKEGGAQDPNWPNDGNQAGYDQNYVNSADGSGNGLPFQIVATQPGIEPGAVGTYAGF